LKRILLILLFIASPVFAQESYIGGRGISDIDILQFDGMSAPSTSSLGDARIYFDTTAGTLKCSEDGGAYTDCVGGGSGDISGPVSSTDNAIPRWDGTGGDALQDSGITVDDSDNITIPSLTSCDTIDTDSNGLLSCGSDATGAGGSAITLDLGDDGGDDSTDLTEIATSGDTNSIFTEPSADKLLITLSNNWPSADTADALSSNPTAATSGSVITDIAADGTVEGEVDVWTEAENTSAAYISASSADTLTNKTFDANGIGNSLSNVDLDDMVAGDIVTEGEGIASNDNDTTLPTSAAVKDYADSNDDTGTDDQTVDVFSFSNPTISLSLEDDGEANKTVDISAIDTTLDLSGAETITGNWVNTANPWADNEVADDITIDLATLATTVTVSDDESTNDNHEIVFTTDNTNLESDGTATYNPSSGTITATAFSGAGTSLTALNGENIQNDTIDDDSIDFSDVTLNDLTFDVNSTTKTEFGYVNGVTSAIQTQLDGKEGTLSNEAGLYSALSDVTDFVQAGEANSIDSDMYVDGSIDNAHLADDVISGATAVGTFESGDTFLCLEAGVGLKECDFDDLPAGGGGGDTYTASGTLLSLTGTAFSVNEGTLTDEGICTYESTGDNLVCDGMTYNGSNFKVNSDSDLFVNGSNGRVGIGTASPGQNLHIQSTASARIELEADTDNANEDHIAEIIFDQDGGAYTSKLRMAGDYNAFVIEPDGGFARMDILQDDTTYWQIGREDDRYHRIDFNNSSSTASNNHIWFRVHNGTLDGLVTALMLEGDGDVGIGIQNPTLRLDVAASESIGFNGTAILSDSAGDMTLSNVDGLDSTTATTIATETDAATTTATGVLELATTTETTTGTSTTVSLTPDSLAGSDFGKRAISVIVFDDSQDVATGDGAGDVFYRVPSIMDGYNIVEVACHVQTSGTTNTTDVQLRNVTDTADVLSTKCTIDSGETDSSTAATAPAINTSNDDVATGDELRFDVDSVSTTAPKGLLVEVQFQLP